MLASEHFETWAGRYAKACAVYQSRTLRGFALGRNPTVLLFFIQRRLV